MAIAADFDLPFYGSSLLNRARSAKAQNNERPNLQQIRAGGLHLSGCLKLSLPCNVCFSCPGSLLLLAYKNDNWANQFVYVNIEVIKICLS
jgi:hypothetical protein